MRSCLLVFEPEEACFLNQFSRKRHVIWIVGLCVGHRRIFPWRSVKFIALNATLAVHWYRKIAGYVRDDMPSDLSMECDLHEKLTKPAERHLNSTIVMEFVKATEDPLIINHCMPVNCQSTLYHILNVRILSETYARGVDKRSRMRMWLDYRICPLIFAARMRTICKHFDLYVLLVEPWSRGVDN